MLSLIQFFVNSALTLLLGLAIYCNILQCAIYQYPKSAVLYCIAAENISISLFVIHIVMYAWAYLCPPFHMCSSQLQNYTNLY